MTPLAVFSRPGHFGSVEWELEGRTLHIAAQGLPPETYSLREITSVTGDDFTIHLGYDGNTMTLSRLGDDGAGLRSRLLEAWPVIRADALQITGTGNPRRYTGTYAACEGSPVPFAGFLYDDVLIIAGAGSDIRPLYLSSLAQFEVDVVENAVTYRTWYGAGGSFTRLDPSPTDFVAAVEEARTRIREEAAEVVAHGLPTLPAPARAALASRWLPGEILALAALEAGSADLGAALRSGWIAATPRAACARTLLEQSDPDRIFIGYERRPYASLSALWLLAGTADSWFLENLHEEGHATYRFRAGSEVPALVSMLLKSRRFSREALYLSPEELTRAHPNLAIPARDLPFLRDLRERFVERIDHDDPAGWATRLTSPA